MGNCLVLQAKVIRIMKTDGKILEYKAPTRVYQVLSEFPGHAISDKLPIVQHLNSNAELIQGHLYYLLPLPVAPKPIKKRVRFSDPVVEAPREDTGVVRIKLVISKQELQALLQKGGVSVDNMISKEQNGLQANGPNEIDRDGNRGWIPALESIPEL